MKLTAYEIARLVIEVGWPAAMELIDAIQGEDPDWVKLKTKVNQPFASLAGARPKIEEL